MKPQFAVTYGIVSDESAESGDYEETGFISEGEDLRYAITDLFRTRTNEVDGCTVEADDARCITVYNGMEFRTGCYETRSLHIPRSVTPASAARITRLILK